MTLTFDPLVYANLLPEVMPMVIETEAEYQRVLTIAEELTFKQDRTLEQQALYKLLVVLIEAYETQNYPMGKSTPREILKHIMESSGTRQADLVGIIGSSGVVSEVVNGQRSISKAQAKALGDYFGDYFKVLPSLFIFDQD